MSADILARILEGKNIVIIDDSRAFIAGLKSLIEESKCQVFDFTDPELALSQLLEIKPDLVVTDLQMPTKDGFFVVEQIRNQQIFDEVPILVLSGNGNPDTMLEAILAGADAFANKSSIRENFIPQLAAMARLRSAYMKVSKGRQLDAVQSLIGTYKHEFGNALAAIEGKLRKLEKSHQSIQSDESLESIKKWTHRMHGTLKKLNSLRKYEEESYASTSKILKVG